MSEMQTIKTYAMMVHDPEVSFEFFCEGESMTQDHLFDLTDVNQIVETFTRTGQLPAAKRQGYYGDVTGLNKPFDQLINESREFIAAAQQASPAAESPPAQSGEPASAGEETSPVAAG